MITIINYCTSVYLYTVLLLMTEKMKFITTKLGEIGVSCKTL